MKQGRIVTFFRFAVCVLGGDVVLSAGAISVPSAVRSPTISPKSLPSLPPSFAAGLWDREAQVELSPLDMQTIAVQDAERAQSGEKTLRIGVTRDLPEQVVLAGLDGGLGQWEALADGSQVWRLTLRANEARGLRVHVSRVALPNGCELRVFDTEDPTTVRGPYTADTLKGRTTFWAGAVFAATVTLECYVPRAADRSGVTLAVDRIAHIYCDPAMLAKEGSCHNDVSCFPAWASAAKGVAGIGSFYQNDYIYCTGCLLNDLDDSTWIDFFLTASHCVANQREASDTEFYWFFQTSSCNGAVPAISSATATDGGADYLAGQSYQTGNDFALLRLRRPAPVGATFVGWSTDTPSSSATLACIHHPDGTYKRISFGLLDGEDPYHWFVTFTSGATEPGSSGAPLFNAEGKIIGQLYGGSAACGNGGGVDVFGRFNVTFAAISTLLAGGSGLSPTPTEVTPVGAYNGLLYRAKAVADGSRALPDVCGTVTLMASKTGRATVKVSLQQKTLRFKSVGWSAPDSDGGSYITATAMGREVLELYADPVGMLGEISGGSLGAETLSLVGSYDVFGDSTDSSAQADLAAVSGYYTVALPVAAAYARGAANEKPGGSGYLTVTVGSKGRVKLAGMLADGSRVSQASKLLLFGEYGTEVCVPVFLPLYARKGGVGGLLWINPESRAIATDWDEDWYVRWDKPGSGPDGFEALLMPCGGYYSKGTVLSTHYRLNAEANAVAYQVLGLAVPPQQMALPQWVGVTATGTRLVIEKGVKPALVDGAYAYTGENSSLATLSFSAFTGIYKGKFNLYYDYEKGGSLMHKTVKVPYVGVMTQVRDTLFNGWPKGQGYYLIQDKDPAFKAFRIKRSFYVDLYDAP